MTDMNKSICSAPAQPVVLQLQWMCVVCPLAPAKNRKTILPLLSSLQDFLQEISSQ